MHQHTKHIIHEIKEHIFPISRKNLHLDSTIPKPSTHHPPDTLQAQQQQSDTAALQSAHPDDSHSQYHNAHPVSASTFAGHLEDIPVSSSTQNE
jgi:hypothetical protein